MCNFAKEAQLSKGVGLGLFPSDSLESQSYEFDEITHKGPPYGVK